jgi:hypothetical protein
MIASRITIFWKSYKPHYPLLVTKDVYDYYKSLPSNKIPVVTLGFWKEFYIQIILIALGILFLLADTYHWYIRGGAMELLGGLIILVAIITALSFILSAISFTSSYIISKEYIVSLNKAINDSKSYENFCQLMSKKDKSYIMQIQRMRTNENAV